MLSRMANPFAGIQLKLIRGLDHLDELHEKGREFIDTKPYGVRFEAYLDKRSGERRVRALLTVTDRPPMAFGLVAGEAVYHLRGALDHLVYGLARLNRSNPRGTQFPLAIDRGAYWTGRPGKESPRDSMLSGVREEHRAIIDAFQPYHDGPLAKRNLLYVLGQFANADKHRLIQPVYGSPSSIKVEPNQQGVELDVRYPVLTPPIDEGAELFSVRWIEGYADVPMHWELVMSLAYGTGLPDFVSRQYIVRAGMRVHDFLARVIDEVPEYGGGPA